jgi:hypothetical protein
LFRARENREKKRRIEILIGCKFGVEDCCSKKRLLLQQGTHSTSADGLPKRTKDYIVLATISFWKHKQTKQEREKKNSLSLSFSRFSVSEDTSSCSFRSLERPQTHRNNNKEQKQAHEKSRSSLSLCAASSSASFGKP